MPVPELTSPAEFHRPLIISRIGAGHAETVVANDAECAALAERMGLPGIAALRCSFTLRPIRKSGFAADGRLVARLVQTCVISLEDFPVAIDEVFRVHFVPAERLGATDDMGAVDDPESDDEIPYHGTIIDLGEATAEQLALVLDAYPRAPGAAHAEPDSSDDRPPHPFAGLGKLRSTD
jgi:hypothetical protein